MIFYSVELRKLVHAVKLFVNIWPGALRNPCSWIRLQMNRSLCAGKQELPFVHVNLVSAGENALREEEGEDEFVLLEERETDVLVERIREVAIQMTKTFF